MTLYFFCFWCLILLLALIKAKKVVSTIDTNLFPLVLFLQQNNKEKKLLIKPNPWETYSKLGLAFVTRGTCEIKNGERGA